MKRSTTIRQRPQRLDLQSSAFKQYPQDTWRVLRNQGPIITTRQPLLGRIALTTRYQPSREVLRNTECFSVDARRCGHKHAAGTQWWVPGLFRPLANNLLSVDGDEHRALRKRVDFAFQRSEINALQADIERFTDKAVTQMYNDLERHGQADFVATIARPVPQWVISQLLGLNKRYVSPDNEFNRALSALGSVQGPIDIFKVLPGIRVITNTLKHEIGLRRQEPRDDLLSRLIVEQGEGRPLSDDELLAMVFLLYVAGHETTTHLLSTSLLSLLGSVSIREQIDQPLTDVQINEFVRYNSPVQMSKPRFVVQDTQLAGAKLKRGDTVAVLIGAANHDEHEFDNSEQFMVSRASSKHLGFGTGQHTCFGLHLALRETSTVLNKVLFEANLRLASNGNPIEWNRRLGLRSLRRLMVEHAA